MTDIKYAGVPIKHCPLMDYPYCYTIGSEPEFVMLTVPIKFLRRLVPLLLEKNYPFDGKYNELTGYTNEGMPIGAVVVDEKHRRLFPGATGKRIIQLVMPDAKGKLPWQEGADLKFFEAQPSLA